MKKKSFFLVLLLSSLILSTAAQEDRFKALFMYNFTRNIDWPPEMHQGDYIIGVLGSKSFESTMSKMLSQKKVGAQSIRIKTCNSPSDISDCHIVFLSNEKCEQVDEVLQQMQEKNILLISNTDGMISKGVGINFQMKEGKLIFEINKSNIEKYGLKVSSSLMSLGKEI